MLDRDRWKSRTWYETLNVKITPKCQMFITSLSFSNISASRGAKVHGTQRSGSYRHAQSIARPVKPKWNARQKLSRNTLGYSVVLTERQLRVYQGIADSVYSPGGFCHFLAKVLLLLVRHSGGLRGNGYRVNVLLCVESRSGLTPS